MKKFRQLAGATVLATLAWSGLAAADAVTDWNDIANNAVAAGRPGPIGAQDLAVVQLAVHDAVQSYEKRFRALLHPGHRRQGVEVGCGRCRGTRRSRRLLSGAGRDAGMRPTRPGLPTTA